MTRPEQQATVAAIEALAARLRRRPDRDSDIKHAEELLGLMAETLSRPGRPGRQQVAARRARGHRRLH